MNGLVHLTGLVGLLWANAVVGQSPTPGSASGTGRVTESGSAPGAQTPTAADVHFMTVMISHHAQAVVMAGWAPSHAASPRVLALCDRIAVSQTDEIKYIQNWL